MNFQTAPSVQGHCQAGDNGLRRRKTKVSNTKLASENRLLHLGAHGRTDTRYCFYMKLDRSTKERRWLIDGHRQRFCVRIMTYQFCDDVIAIRDVLFKHEMKATVNKQGGQRAWQRGLYNQMAVETQDRIENKRMSNFSRSIRNFMRRLKPP